MEVEYSRHDLEEHLARLGVGQGDTLLVHASFKSLGQIQSGAAAVIEAFENVLGKAGTLLMPGFNLCSPDKAIRAGRWNPATTPSTVGYLTEFMRQLSGTVRSDHYSHSFLARGAQAEYLVSGHTSNDGEISPWDREPWGRTFGKDSPLVRAMELDARVLLLGTGHKSLTYWHLVEVRDWNARLREDENAPYRPIDRGRAGKWWEGQREARVGNVGDARCQIFAAKALVDRALETLSVHPENFYLEHVSG